MRKLRRSIPSDYSTHVAPKSFDETYITSSYVNTMGTILFTSSYSFKAEHVGFSMRGICMSGFFFRRTSAIRRPDLVQISPGRRPLPRPCSLPVSFLEGRLAKLPEHHHPMVLPCYCIIILFYPPDIYYRPGCLFRLRISHQANMHPLFSEVYLLQDTGPEIPGPTVDQHICENGMGKDEGYLKYIDLVNDPLPLHCQDCCEPAPYCSLGHGILAL